MRVVYLLGVPGAGKTTLLSRSLDYLGWRREPVVSKVPHERLVVGTSYCVGAHLGTTRAAFGGTDALSMSIAPLAETWLSAEPYPLVIAEGDRLGTLKFLNRIAAFATVDLVHLDTPHEKAAANRLARARSTRLAVQSAAWVRGRETKVANVVSAFKPAHTLDGSLDQDALVPQLARILSA